jgi:hypothetical protein
MRQIDVILTNVILLLFKPIKHSNKLTTALMKNKACIWAYALLF